MTLLVLTTIAGFIYFFLKNKLPIQPTVTYPTLPISCIDEDEGTPVITSLSTYTGEIGSRIEIFGCNFSGFEGDLTAWIENEQGVKGILYSEQGSNSKHMLITLNRDLCQMDISYKGGECENLLTLIPGKYKICTEPWGKRSNEVSLTITN